MNKWKWASAAIISALLLTMSIMLFDREETTAVEAPRLKTDKSKEQDFVKKWDVTGFAQSKNTFDIDKDSSLGTIKEIQVNEGESVTSGQTLVTYENNELENELRRLKREKEAADVKAEHYSSEISDWQSELSAFDEEKDDANAKVLLQKQLAEAELQSDLAEKESTVLSEEISELEKQLDELSLKSPVDGVVTDVNRNDNEKPLVEIVGQGNYEIKAEVNGNIAGIVKTGDTVEFTTAASNKKQIGTIQTIKPSKKDQMFSISVLVEGDSSITEGQKATIVISETLSADAISVPKKAVIHYEGKTYVYTIDKSKIYKHVIKTGLKQNGLIEIKKGLKKGQFIVLNPSKVFVSGEPAINLTKK
jgi:RND family efflux transporter MFP subunit